MSTHNIHFCRERKINETPLFLFLHENVDILLELPHKADSSRQFLVKKYAQVYPVEEKCGKVN